MLEFLKPFNVVTLILALVGLFLAYYFYKAAQPLVDLRYVLNTEMLAKLDRSDLRLTKDGNLLTTRSLYRTFIGIWNAGTVPIETGSIRRPLTIEFRPDTILDASVVRQSNTVIGLDLKPGKTSVVGTWEHFDPRYYVIIGIYHYDKEIPQPSLRYIGDQEILSEVAADLSPANIAAAWVTAMFVVVLLALLFSQFGNLMIDKVLPDKRKVVGTGLAFAVIIFGGAYVWYFFLTARFIPITRSIMGITVPTEIAQTLAVDRGTTYIDTLKH
jgi:hypothetical protein